MLKSKIKDLKTRLSFRNFEKKNLICNFLRVNTLSKDDSFHYEMSPFFMEKSTNNKSLKTKITRRCILNNRSRGTLRSFGLSRVYLRELLQFGKIPGYSKAIW
jgi:small subunit ribosomal protein S14